MCHSTAMYVNCVSLPLQGTSVGAPMLVQGTVLWPVTRAPIHMQGLTFLLVASAPMLILGAAGVPVSIQGVALPPMADAPMLSQGTPFPDAYMAPASWPIYMPSLLSLAQAASPTTLSERELLFIQCEEALKRIRRELEAVRKTQALALQNSQPQSHPDQTGPRAVSTGSRDAEIRSTAHSERNSRACTSQEQAPIQSKCAWSQPASHRSLSPQRGYLPGIVFPKLSALSRLVQMHASPKPDQDRPVQAKDLVAFRTDIIIAAIMRDMIKFLLTESGVVPKSTPPPQSQSQSRYKVSNIRSF